MATRFSKLFILLVLSFLVTQTTNSQVVNKTAPPTEVYYSTSSSTDDLNALTKTQPKQESFSEQKQDLLNRLDEARLSGDIQKKELIEAQLNQINGISTSNLIANPNIHGGAASNNGESIYDINYSTIAAGGFWGSATQTTPSNFPNPGVIWVATNQYNASGADTCKVYYSTNGGQTFTYAYYYTFGINMDFRAGEIDIELLYDGTTVWIYGVSGYNDLTTSRTNTVLFRFNTTTSAFSGYLPAWPGNTTTTNLYYNPRITSDNSVYTSGSYIYFSASFDSTGTSSSHINRQKFAHITNPFAATPTIDYTMPSSNGGFYWNSSSAPAGSYLWTDLAFFRTSTSTNRILTVYNVPGSSNYNLYLAWSDDYGATLASSSSITESNIDYGARIAFNGGTNNYNGMIVYVRQFSGTDYDPYYRATTDGGANWTAGYVDGSSNRTRSVDVIAPRGAANSFKVAYNQDSASSNYIFYTGGNSLAWNAPYRRAVSPAGADSSYTKGIAGYKNGGGDDCFSLFSNANGTNLYAVSMCLVVNGISNNNEVPKTYSLSQNYPNPFNPTTSIKFSIPTSGNVRLSVYDVLGNEVATLQKGKMNAGNYIVDFNSTGLSSGVYFYKLTADNFSEVKKMVLIK